MVGSLIVAAALMGQAPAAKAEKPAAAAARRKPAPRANSLKARRAAFWRQVELEGRRRDAEKAKAQAEYEKRYKEMLPYLMEEQRQYLNRLSAMERNAALMRMAEAAERQASAAGRAADAAWWAAYRR
jgi:hypothetical protein